MSASREFDRKAWPHVDRLMRLTDESADGMLAHHVHEIGTAFENLLDALKRYVDDTERNE